MTYRALLAATATGLAALLGCAAAPLAQMKTSDTTFKEMSVTFEKAYGSALCTGGPCEVTVTVGDNCRITVTPYTLGVPRAAGQNIPIHWRLSGAKFAATRGVYFKGDVGNEFDNPRRLSDTQFMWNDKNPQGSPRARPFPYGINVEQNGKPCPTYDPTVVNDY